MRNTRHRRAALCYLGRISDGVSPASAGESDAHAPQCNLWKSNSAPYTGYAGCKGRRPTSVRRVKVTCVDPHGSRRIVWGPPRRNQQTSTAKCSDTPNAEILKVSVAYVD